MFTVFEFATSTSASLLVGIYSGETTDNDYQRCVSALFDFERVQRGHERGLAVVLVTDPDVPPVPAAWRKQMAKFDDSVQATPYLLAIVTPSPIIRGVLTAISWLAPARAGQKRQAHETFEKGRAWIEKERGREEPALVELYNRARTTISGRASA